MIGNVWEWTSDWYADRGNLAELRGCCIPRNPHGGTEKGSHNCADPGAAFGRKVLKGGSQTSPAADDVPRSGTCARQITANAIGLPRATPRPLIRPRPTLASDASDARPEPGSDMDVGKRASSMLMG
jgi:hypothetical protein